MYCNECGTGNTPDSKFCKECGGKFNTGYREMMLSVQDTHAIEDEATQERVTNLLEMAFWHNENGNLDPAILACEAVLAINKNSTTAHSLLGSLFEKKGDDAKAISHFESVLALNPESAADEIKLDRLKRGVRVKAVAPPVHYKWVPPALTGLSLATMREKLAARPPGSLRPPAFMPTPAVLAGSAAALVFVVGLLSIRPAARTALATSLPSATVPGVPTSSSVRLPGDVSPGAIAANAAPPPGNINAVPPTVKTPAKPGNAPVNVAAAPDPFSDALKLYDTPLPRSARAVSVPSRPRAASRSGGDSPSALPPLSLHAVPMETGSLEGGSLAPAPVRIASALPGEGGGVPQHTVVVNSLNGQPTPQEAEMTSASRIRITMDSAGNGTTEVTPMKASRESGEDGAAHQQTALSLQQSGNFKAARAAYNRAIRAYKTQVASGRDVEAAQRGLAACQTGLQICQQSQ